MKRGNAEKSEGVYQNLEELAEKCRRAYQHEKSHMSPSVHQEGFLGASEAKLVHPLTFLGTPITQAVHLPGFIGVTDVQTVHLPGFLGRHAVWTVHPSAFLGSRQAEGSLPVLCRRRRHPLVDEGAVGARGDGLAHAAHEVEQVEDVVLRDENGAEYLLLAHEVVQVRT